MKMKKMSSAFEICSTNSKELDDFKVRSDIMNSINDINIIFYNNSLNALEMSKLFNTTPTLMSYVINGNIYRLSLYQLSKMILYYNDTKIQTKKEETKHSNYAKLISLIDGLKYKLNSKDMENFDWKNVIEDVKLAKQLHVRIYSA